MNWIQKLIQSLCVRYNIQQDQTGAICLNQYKIRIIRDEELFSLKIIDLNQWIQPKQIHHIFCDDLEMNLEKTIKEIM